MINEIAARLEVWQAFDGVVAEDVPLLVGTLDELFAAVDETASDLNLRAQEKAAAEVRDIPPTTEAAGFVALR